MKIIKYLLTVTLSLSGLLIIGEHGYSQDGNRSDITGPNPQEILPGNSDRGGPDPVDINKENSEIINNNDYRDRVEIDKYQNSIATGSFIQAIQLQEEFQAFNFGQYLDLDLKGKLPTVDEIAHQLYLLWQITGKKTALVYVSSQTDRLETFVIFPRANQNQNKQGKEEEYTLRKTLLKVQKEQVQQQLEDLRENITKLRGDSQYLESGKQLNQWIMEPIASQLQANKIDILIFSLDSGLRTLPLAALYDGEKFLIEKYAVGIIPSFGLTDVGYLDARKSQILAMGVSDFQELDPLPSVPLELQSILRNSWTGESFLNEQVTLDKFIDRNRQNKYGIVHLATHGYFELGDANNSYIQFFDRKLTIPELRKVAIELGWTSAKVSPIELLILSACQTAYGDENSELGFAGISVATGVKSTIASLWSVSDLGTLALMSEFYNQLNRTPVKAEALRNSQIALLKGEVRIEGENLILSNGDKIALSSELAEQAESISLSNPFIWSAFESIGNWN
jgi:CHAT domain-containing protein